MTFTKVFSDCNTKVFLFSYLILRSILHSRPRVTGSLFDINSFPLPRKASLVLPLGNSLKNISKVRHFSCYGMEGRMNSSKTIVYV